MRRSAGFLPILFFFLALTGCYDKPTPLMKDAAVGGLTGAAIGAGSGALIGSLITNGDVAMSALFGGGIGLGAGVAIALTSRIMAEQTEMLANESAIASNEKELVENYQTIGGIRSDLQRDNAGVALDPERRRHIFVGPSLGTYNR